MTLLPCPPIYREIAVDTVIFLIFFLPAYVANMAPVFVRKVNVLAYPVDGGAKWNKKPLFGKNKTWRGLVFGTLMAALVGFGLQLLWPGFYIWWWGALLGFAALVGDMIKSMFKRQRNIRPGGSWIPFDQLDFIIVAYLVSLFLYQFMWQAVVAGFIIIFLGNLLVQFIGARLRLKADSL